MVDVTTPSTKMLLLIGLHLQDKESGCSKLHIMAARLDDVDFTGICQCIPPLLDYTCKQGSQTWQHVVRIVVKLPTYLNSSAKWMHILKSSYCIHRWIYLLDIIFKSRLDERCEKHLMYY